MKELDFDELDKAVNSLMGSASKSTPPPKPADEKADTTLTISPTLSDDTKPDFATIDAQAAQSADSSSQAAPVTVSTPASAPSVTVPARTQAAAPAARRGGRFMDVVHPSSDMKQATVPARPISREGVTIAPTATPSEPTTQPEMPSPEPVKPTPDTADLSNTTPASEVVSETPNEWPDPLDMADFKQSDTEDTSADAPKAVDEPAAPLTSPFLADAKVEKRPLGGTPLEPADSSEELLKPEEIKDDSFTVSDPADQLPADPEKVDMPLPEELRSDLVAIESGAHMEKLTAGDAHDETPVDETKDKHEMPAEEKKTTGLPPASTDTKETAPAPTGPTSIAQQYKEEPSSGDQSSGAIYDTDTYHQPLAHPVKKKSGWMWVLWILLILVVGAGGGAALYFLGLI